MTLPLDRDYITGTLADLVRINSINPALEPGGPGEREIAAYVGEALAALGCQVATHEPEAGRVSVVGRLGGTRGRSLMLNAHMDTVGVEGMAGPFSGAVRDGKLFGRGAYDMKGSLAACLGAVKALADAKTRLPGAVLVAAVADEEHASLGTADLIGHYHPDAAIVTEPTGLEICLAHKGFAWIEVATAGRAAHGSRPDLGVDANMAMGRVLAALAPLERELRARPPHALVGPPSLHAGVLAGGTAPSVYAARATVTIERRTVPGETDEQVVREIEDAIARLRRDDPALAVHTTLGLSRPPFEVSRDAEVVQALARAYRTALGRAPTFGGQTPWMDSALLAEAGVETVVFGPGGEGAHAAEEWVDLESVFAVAAVLAEAVAEYCG
jgi:acetylornithine deacetylase